MQDITDVFNKEIDDLPRLIINDLLRLTTERTKELSFNNVRKPQWFGVVNDSNAEILLFSSPEKSKKYEARVQAYLDSGKDKALLAPANFSMLKFNTKEYIGHYGSFIAAVNVAPYLDNNGILICGPIKKDGSVFEKLQKWNSIDETDLLNLQQLTVEQKIIVWGCFMLPSNNFAHFHFMTDTYENKKLPLVQAIDSGLYDKTGIRLASSGLLCDVILQIRIVNDARSALRQLQEAEVNNIKSDIYIIRGKFLLLHYKAHDNVVRYIFGRQWIPSPDGIGFTLDDDRIRNFSVSEVIKDFWYQKNNQLRPLD